MANFNQTINSETGYIMCDQDFFIYRAEAMKEFERNIDDDLYCRTNPYRLFIQYKATHRVKKLSGRIFMWKNSHGDHMVDPGNGIELRSVYDASKDDCEGFGNPRFDAVSAAIFITDHCVFVYGDVQIEVYDITQDKKYIVCTVSLCGSIVSCFRIPAQTFDRRFGLQENFPKQSRKNAEEEIECVEVSFSDSDECEQDEANEKTTECTACEKLSKENGDDTYHRNLCGFEFFDVEKYQEDIEDVKSFIDNSIGMLRGVLRRLDEAQESVEKNAGLTDEGWHLLQKSKYEMDVTRGMLLAMINEVANVEWKACKYKCTDAQERD